MSTIDLALDKTTHDLVFKNNDLALVRDADKLVQKLKQRLLFFQGDWFLDTSAGLPYFSDIFVKQPNINDVDSIFKVEIVETEDVQELLSFTSSFENDVRKYSLKFSVGSPFGIIEFEQSIFVGVT